MSFGDSYVTARGTIMATASDGSQFEIYMDDRGHLYRGLTTTVIVPFGLNAAEGHTVEIFIPQGGGTPIPMNVRVQCPHIRKEGS